MNLPMNTKICPTVWMNSFSFLTLPTLLVLTAGLLVAATENPLQAQQQWGHLTGKVVVTGELPEIPREELGTNADREYCLDNGEVPLDKNLIVNDKNELRDVLVMMFLTPDETEPAYHPMYEELKQQPATLDNVRCCFEPHALFVRTGQKLQLKNSDTIGHNCHIITFNNEHNINLPAGGTVEITLDKEERAPGEVKCDIHPWMDSVIMVRNNPYVAFTDAEGNFQIENIPAGNWKFQFWHKKAGWLRQLEVEGYTVGRRGELEVSIEDGQALQLGTLKLPADAFKK
jgi:plastocyanin